MDDAQRGQAAAAIERMLHWSLTQSLQPDGSFTTPGGFDSSVSDAQYYGVSLLTKAGYCSTRPAFWTDRGWPDAKDGAAASPDGCAAHEIRRPRRRASAWRRPTRMHAG